MSRRRDGGDPGTEAAGSPAPGGGVGGGVLGAAASRGTTAPGGVGGWGALVGGAVGVRLGVDPDGHRRRWPPRWEA
jgi:hypothetical protein